jgi:hypothetical protein
LRLYYIILRRLFDLKGAMNIKRAYKASNAVGLTLELKASSLYCSFLIRKLNTKLKTTRIATMKAILRILATKNRSVPPFIQITMSPRTASLYASDTLLLVELKKFWGTTPYIKMNFSAILELGKLPLKTTAKTGNFSGEFPSNLSWGVKTGHKPCSLSWQNTGS